MWNDLRFAWRQLARAPLFAAVAVLTLGLGIGVNAAAFSVVNAALLRPTPHVRAPERLVALYTSDFSGPAYGTSAYADVAAFDSAGRRAGVFAGVAARATRLAGVGPDDARARVLVETVSGAYFDVLGVRPLLGRAFTAEEARGAAAPAVVVSHALWRERFGGARAALGRTLLVNARPAVVVGVLPPGFQGGLRGARVDVWVPLLGAGALGIEGVDPADRGHRSLDVVARLAPGVAPARAQRVMDAVARQLHAAHPDAWADVRGQGRRVTLLGERLARIPTPLRTPVLAFGALLTVAVGLVLVACCANVAGIMLARATGRGREIGVRLSLGATRRRLARQLLTESALLAVLGACLGLALASAAVAALARVQPPTPVPVAFDLSPDGRVLAHSLLVTALAALFFGLAPALRASRARPNDVLRADGGSYGAAARRTRAQGLLVAGQLATSLLLVVGALLFLRAVRAAGAVDPGFAARDVLLVPLDARPGAAGDSSPAAAAARVRARLAGAAGVEAVSWANAVPLGLDLNRRGTTVAGYGPAPGEDMEFAFNVVGPGYFETLGVPLARGRGFTDGDRAGAPRVVVVNESFARRFWPGGNPIGRRVGFAGPRGPFAEVVGVARDGKYQSLAEAPRPYVYVPALQDDGWNVVLHVRTAGDPRTALPAVRAAVAAAAPAWEAGPARTLREHVDASLLPQRLAGRLLAGFGAFALLLAAVGVYGVVAYTAARRTREIGVRVALGARASDVVRLVMGQSLALVAWALAAGLPLAWLASRLLGALLFGREAVDAVALVGATLLLAATAAVAAYLPARRAAHVDPLLALRAD